MKVLKEGGHRLFETDPETARYVSELLERLRRGGLKAVRELSAKFDDWAPKSFELSAKQIAEAVAQCPKQLQDDTKFCQGNVRRFARAQLRRRRYPRRHRAPRQKPTPAPRHGGLLARQQR